MLNKTIRLKDHIVLDKEVLKEIRRKHEDQYAFRSKKEQNILLEDEINKLVDEALEGIPPMDIIPLRLKIIQSSFLMRPSGLPISYESIYNLLQMSHKDKSYFEIWYHGHAETYSFLDKVKTWLLSIDLKEKSMYLKAGVTTLMVILFIGMLNIITVEDHHHLHYDFDVPMTNTPGRAIAYLKDVDKINIKIIPEYYRYQPLNKVLIQAYLKERASKLSDDYYLDAVDRLARDYYINPILLIAITGQEQGFVPLDHQYADDKINNPYNVFNSWKKYNTDFEDATRICLNTITTAINSRPESVDLIDHLNNKYSEDTQWQRGVKYFYDHLYNISIE